MAHQKKDQQTRIVQMARSEAEKAGADKYASSEGGKQRQRSGLCSLGSGLLLTISKKRQCRTITPLLGGHDMEQMRGHEVMSGSYISCTFRDHQQYGSKIKVGSTNIWKEVKPCCKDENRDINVGGSCGAAGNQCCDDRKVSRRDKHQVQEACCLESNC